MKKKIALLLAFAMLLALVGCKTGGNDTPSDDITATEAPTKPTDAPKTTETPSPTDAPAPTDDPAPTDVTATVNIDSILEAYRDYLDELVDNSGDGYYHAAFSLGLVDDDEVPELFVSWGNDMGEPVTVYTYTASSGVVECGTIGSFGGLHYQPRKNIIMWENGFTMNRTIFYQCIDENKKISTFTELSAEYPSDEEAYYYIDGQPVDSAAFFAKQDEIDGPFNLEGEDRYVSFVHDSSQTYSDYVFTDKMSILKAMYDDASAGIAYSGNLPSSYPDLYGEWELEEFYTYHADDPTGNSNGYSAEDATNIRLNLSEIGGYLRVNEDCDVGLDIEPTAFRFTYFSPSLREDMMNTEYCYKYTYIDGMYVFPIYMTDYIDGDGTQKIEVLLICNPDAENEVRYHFEFRKYVES